MPPLDELSRARYARQIALPEIGEAGQARLLASSALVIGAGGLGSPVALYLAAAGVGRLGILDCDKVDLSNLQRQILHGTGDLGRPKSLSAVETLRELDPALKLDRIEARFDASNADSLVADYDFIVDATDNFASKTLIGETAWRHGKPHSHAGLSGFSAQLMTVLPPEGPCVRCLFREIPEDPAVPRGPIGALAGVIGSLQALEAIKFLAGLKPSFVGCVLAVDGLSSSFRKIPLKANSRCPLCAAR